MQCIKNTILLTAILSCVIECRTPGHIIWLGSGRVHSFITTVASIRYLKAICPGAYNKLPFFYKSESSFLLKPKKFYR